jgi:hypothetical protein
MTDDFLYEFAKVRKVIKSCVTTKQSKAADLWAQEWCKRAVRQYPEITNDWRELYKQVISE